MWGREDDQEFFEPFDTADWPDDDLEIDDEEFARAIAEGRGEELAA